MVTTLRLGMPSSAAGLCCCLVVRDKEVLSLTAGSPVGFSVCRELFQGLWGYVVFLQGGLGLVFISFFLAPSRSLTLRQFPGQNLSSES